MTNYSELSIFIIKNVGGKENVQSVEHCTTRLRFKLRDSKLADTVALKEHDGIAGVTQNNGQYQIIIGMDVPNVYKAVAQELNLSDNRKIESGEKKKKTEIFTDFISGVMGTIIPYMIACGIITGVSFLLIILGILTAESPIYLLLNAIGNSLFYFFPFILGYSVMRYLEMNPILGILLAAILCHPSINGVDLNFWGTPLNVTYTSTFLPIVFTCLIAKPIFTFFNRILPEAIRSFSAIAFTILLAGSLGFLFIGPVTNSLSEGISKGIVALYELNPIVCGIVLGGVYELLVLLGLHNVLALVTMNNIIAGNPDVIAGLTGAALFACMFTVLAMTIKTKNKKQKSNYLGSFIASLFGVTEPIVYGPLLGNINMFVIVCLSSALGGLLAGIWNIQLHTYSGMGIIALLGFIDPKNSSSLFYVLAMVVIVSAVSFILTFIFYKDKSLVDKKESMIAEQLEDKPGKVTLHSPVNGEIRATKLIEDDTFRGEYLGKTIAVIPDEGVVYAPFDGIIKAVFPTKHAIGLLSDSGCEVLIHVGIDTVKLDGKYFDCKLTEGDRVKQGGILLQFDKEKIQQAGYPIDVLTIITNSDNYKNITINQQGKMAKGDLLGTLD